LKAAPEIAPPRLGHEADTRHCAGDIPRQRWKARLKASSDP
jgi:hypothetical protein